MLKTKVKASSVTHLTDARYFAAWEVEWLGFNLSANESSAVDPRQVAAIQGWIDGVKICGEFGLPTAADLSTATELLALDAIQVGMFTEVETIKEWGGSLPIMKEIVIDRETKPEMVEEILEDGKDWVSFFIFNFVKGGVSWSAISETNISESMIQQWAATYPVVFEINLDAETPSSILTQFPLAGFSVRGGEEEKTGYKSFDELDEFFEDLEVLV